MFDKTKDKGRSFSGKRIEDAARTADVVGRARQATNSAIGQAQDRLGTPGLGRERV